MIRALAHGQRGVSLVIVLAFMALSAPLITGALGLASTLSVDSRIKTTIVKSQYATMGGVQHAIHRLTNEAGYLSSLTAGVPSTYTLTLGGEDVDITVEKLVVMPPPPSDIGTDASQRIQTTKVVTPTTAEPDTLTDFTYTITVENRDDEARNLTKVHDRLPSGFSYVPGSTSGVTTSDPSISGQVLTWDTAPLGITLQPGQSVTLTFHSQASVGEANYCNEAWIEPGGEQTSSGPTAKITVGSPPNGLCQGAAVDVAKTVDPQVALSNVLSSFTYTITIENGGTVVLNMSQIRDLLPPFFFYVSGSAAGDITTSNPQINMFSGRQRLTWAFSPQVQVQPGQTKTLTFQATAQAGPGDYWNEVWVTLDEFANPVYTWPTAPVTILDVVSIIAVSQGTRTESEVWFTVNGFLEKTWDVARSS
ncbi:MAG: DUF11 domain-containing protein [Chloroflexi bacterium]|nr:DUF11 domain-containing protein [Chloroflexota bacterium]